MANQEKISYTPQYLQKHNLWDSMWLEKKYPEHFKTKKRTR